MVLVVGLGMTRIGEKRERAGFWWGNSERRRYIEDLGVHKIILKRIYGQRIRRRGLDYCG